MQKLDFNRTTVLDHEIGATPEFIEECEQIVNGLTLEYGVPVLYLVFSEVRHTGRLGDYSAWQNRARIFDINGRQRHELFTTVLHELAHHIHNNKVKEARLNKDWELAHEMQKGGRAHGKGFKQTLKDLEHRFYPYGHSAWGSAGCRNSSRASRQDWQQRNSVCKESDMAKTAAKKNTATKTVATKTSAKPSAKPVFAVTVTIEKPYTAMAKGLTIAPHSFTVYAEANDEIAAQNKVLRAYGLAHRQDVAFSVVNAKADKAPRAAAYKPVAKAS